jgi:hypothetical protein
MAIAQLGQIPCVPLPADDAPDATPAHFRLIPLHILIHERHRPRHGRVELVRDVVIVAGIRVKLHRLARGLHFGQEQVGIGGRDGRVGGAVMQLQRAAQVGQVAVGREAVPERRVLVGCAVLSEHLAATAARAEGAGRGCGAGGGVARVRHLVDDGGDGAGPDHAGLDVFGDDHGPQGDLAAHGMAPHADTVGVGVLVRLQRGQRVEHVGGVVSRAEAGLGLALGLAVAPVVGLDGDVAGARKGVLVGHITLGGDVLCRRDVAVVEDHHRPAGRGFWTIGHGHQGVYLQAVRAVRDDVAGIVGAGRQGLLEGDFAARVGPRTLDRDRQGVSIDRDGRGGGPRRAAHVEPARSARPPALGLGLRQITPHSGRARGRGRGAGAGCRGVRGRW